MRPEDIGLLLARTLDMVIQTGLAALRLHILRHRVALKSVWIHYGLTVDGVARVHVALARVFGVGLLLLHGP